MVKYTGQGIPQKNISNIVPGKVSWKSPSNIAIVKYWGKYGNQLPRNPSISLTLSEACSLTSIEYGPRTTNDEEHQLSFLFEGKENTAFLKKIRSHFDKLDSIFPFLRQLSFKIESSNSFPHSSGIASSASSMSALALCLCDIEHDLFDNLESKVEFKRKASFVARLCSGSACRSVYPYVGLWGKIKGVEHSSDYFAIGISEKVHPVFHGFHDDILIISKKEKSVSSTAGHRLMDGNIYSSQRYTQAYNNIDELCSIMKAGDVDSFGKLAESEALTLHALMMCSDPSYILLQPNSLNAIEKIRNFRNNKKIPIYFTLDAGPNLHVLYPDSVVNEVRPFIEEELKMYCEDGKIIYDTVGTGPTKTA
jgi:diphosphomevalonate decarboxylase